MNQSPRTVPGLANTVFIAHSWHAPAPNGGQSPQAGPKKGGEVYSSRCAIAKAGPLRKASLPAPPVRAGITSIIVAQRMGSGRLLDSSIAALDRALRAVLAPARSSRPIPT